MEDVYNRYKQPGVSNALMNRFVNNIGYNIRMGTLDFSAKVDKSGLSNADKFVVTQGLTDGQLNNLEELLVFAYNLGYGHGQDFMDGKRPQDAPLPFFQDQYGEYGGE
jgi:hypothetical protein